MKKILVLDRNENSEFSDFGTTGGFFENNVKICDTLELHEEQNKKRESHIPVGEYECVLINSPKYGEVYEIQNVPNRGNILIHWANFAGDTDKGLETDLLGCVAVGNGYGEIKNKKGNFQFAILKSKATFKIFMNYMKGENFKLIVKD